MFEWDEAKRPSNIEKHGVDFTVAARCDWASAVIIADERRDYGEDRYVAFVLLDVRLHVVVFAQRSDGRRLISVRKANSREVRAYEEKIDRSDGRRGS